MKKYNEILVLDTNIILNDVENLQNLSDNGNNLIVLPETVLDEIDSKKSGFDEINFQAREFGRLFEQAELINVQREKQRIITSSRISKNGITYFIDVVSKTKYASDDPSTPNNIRNDRKIIEIARDLTIEYKKKVIFISLDVMARHRALSLGINTRSMKIIEDENIQIFTEVTVESHKDYYEIFEIESMDIPSSVQTLQVTDSNGKPQFYYKTGNIFSMIDEKDLGRQEITPVNMGQKFLSSQMLDNYYDIVITNAPAGSGKTLIALSAAMRLLDKNKDKYDKIVYIRKTVISDSEELGFLKGDLDEKTAGYLAPLYSNLDYIIDKKYNKGKNKLSSEEFELKRQEIIDKYQIQFKYEGHLRGDNIRNAIVILDEFQNNSISSAKTILTRISENCKVFILGSTRQIDNKFLNKYNNALTFLLNKIGKDNKLVKLTGANLTKTVRSSIADWADEF